MSTLAQSCATDILVPRLPGPPRSHHVRRGSFDRTQALGLAPRPAEEVGQGHAYGGTRNITSVTHVETIKDHLQVGKLASSVLSL